LAEGLPDSAGRQGASGRSSNTLRSWAICSTFPLLPRLNPTSPYATTSDLLVRMTANWSSQKIAPPLAQAPL
jgi:hypothetical protein